MITWHTTTTDDLETICYWHFDEETREIVLDRPMDFRMYGVKFTVPAGYRSDGMSVPRFFWRSLSPQYDPVTLIPSLAHDWLYDSHVCERQEADEWYREELMKNGFGAVKSYIVYWGVQWFGGSHW